MKLELDRSGPPAYAQIIERIESAVSRGELKAGDRLPPERRLAAELGVSRMTLRQALATLESRGLVTRTTGRRGGTFVASPKVERDVSAFAGLSEQLRRQNVTAGARLLSAVEEPAGEAVAEALQLALGDPVAEIVRVRLADREPLALERSTLPSRPLSRPAGARSDRLPVRPAVGAVFGAADPRGRAPGAGAGRRLRVQDTRGRARGAADARRAHRLCGRR